MERPDAQQRAKWVERWKDSGLTAKEFASEAGLKASALYSWRAQLSAAARKDNEGRDASEHATQSQRTRSAKREKRAAPRSRSFVELPVAEVTRTPAMLELLLGDVRVRVPSGFDEVTLTRVVRALGAMR